MKAERDYTSDGYYLYIKAHNPYVPGVVGTDIDLTFEQKIKILFSKGICVCIGDAIKKRGTTMATEKIGTPTRTLITVEELENLRCELERIYGDGNA